MTLFVLREFCEERNSDFIKKPLPDITDTKVWEECMELWRKMRSIHKSSKDPSDEEIDQFTNWVSLFQEKISSLTWVPAPNQVHRLTHLGFFMQSKPIKSIGAYSLEGLGK